LERIDVSRSESAKIRQELGRSLHRDRFEFKMTRAAQTPELLVGLHRYRPTVVHFTGHGNEDGLYFWGADGRIRLISTAALTDTFRATRVRTGIDPNQLVLIKERPAAAVAQAASPGDSSDA
jgi:hypothetical protein